MKIWEKTEKILKNPHFWVTIALSAMLLILYQAWPWRGYIIEHGFWSHIPWISHLWFLVLKVEAPHGLLGILFLIPITYASFTMSWPAGLLAWLLSLIWVLPKLLSWHDRTISTNLIILLIPVLLAVFLSSAQTRHKHQKMLLLEREKERQAYLTRLMDNQETERQKLARDIHDETIQTLLVISNKLNSLIEASSDDNTKSIKPSDYSRNGQTEELKQIEEQLLQGIEELRRLSMNLRPSVLDSFGLIAGIRWLVDNTYSSKCNFTTLVEGQMHDMSNAAEIITFRIVQESVTNIQRHSQAQNATVTLRFDESFLHLNIQDNGIGFQQAKYSSQYIEHNKMGIVGMKQRIMNIGGTIHIDSRPGQGTKIQAVIPYYLSS